MCNLTVKSLVNKVVALDVVWTYTCLNIFFQTSAELD